MTSARTSSPSCARALLLACALAAFSALAVQACKTKTFNESTGKSSSEALRRVPDPEKGYDFLVNGNYIGCGIPSSLLRRAKNLSTLVPKALVAGILPLASDEVFSPSDLKGRKGINATLDEAYNGFTTKRGVEAINFSCLSCHSDRVDGKTIVGLGNATRDFTGDLKIVSAALRTLVTSKAEGEELARFRDAIEAIAPYSRTLTIGTNPAVSLTYALFARRTESFEWSSKFEVPAPPEGVPPVDVPPWWRMARKKTMFHNGEFDANHHRVMALAATLCLDSGEEMAALDDSFRDVEAWVRTVKAPAYPHPVDEALAAAGKPVYERHCSSCHGTYGEGGRYVENFTPIEKVGTDRALMEQQTGPDYLRFRKHGEVMFKNILGEPIVVSGKRGYLAPPLDGVWATAPFLHNGSVPTLEGVIDSKKRPRYWERIPGSTYDSRRMAWPFLERRLGRDLELRPFHRRYVYDTTLPGYGNSGHTYGDALGAEERASVIEYLKTL